MSPVTVEVAAGRFCRGQEAGVEALPPPRLAVTASPPLRCRRFQNPVKAGRWRQLQGPGQSMTLGRGQSQGPVVPGGGRPPGLRLLRPVRWVCGLACLPGAVGVAGAGVRVHPERPPIPATLSPPDVWDAVIPPHH